MDRSALQSHVRADSLRARAERRLRALADLPDSERVEALDEALDELGGAIENISRELSNLDLQVEDQAISLRDRESGGQVHITIPPDIGEQISRGISSITATILSELPDTLRIKGRQGVIRHVGEDTLGGRQGSGKGSGGGHALWVPKQLIPPPPRVIGGDVVKVFGDVQVESDEQVEGNVVAVFGDVTLRGRVNGDAVAVFGQLRLAPGARVTGNAVAVGGQLERDESAKVVGSVFALDPGFSRGLGAGASPLWQGWLALLLRAALFVLALVFLAVLFAFAPRRRIDAVLGTMRECPGSCLGHGLLWLLAGHLLLGFLAGVLVLTIIGIPLALLLLLAYAGVALLAIGLAAWRLGSSLLAARGDTPRGWFGAVLLGLLLLHLPGLAGALSGLADGAGATPLVLGLVGIGVKLVAFAYGLGALVLSRFGARSVPLPPLVDPARTPLRA